jgi:ribosome biogenesis GTPase
MPGRKYKGTDQHGAAAGRAGLGRLRRAAGKDVGRVGRWEDKIEDETLLDLTVSRERGSHSGESLLARFNRLAAGERGAVAEGEAGEISGVAGASLIVRDAAGAERPCAVRTGLLKRIGGVRNPLVVGDQVRWRPDADHHGNGVIVAVLPRRNQLARADSHNRAIEHVVAANLDRLVVTSALHEPDLKYGLLDRYLLIAAASGIPAAVVVTKADLGDPGPALALYRSLDIPAEAVGRGVDDAAAIAALHRLVDGAAVVVVGQSGVGKSTLINRLFPGAAARVGVVADAGHGRHTTVGSRSWLLPGGGRLVDTPGIRECGIGGLRPVDVAMLYPDLAASHPACRFADCTHRHEPGCAVLAAVTEGRIAATRYESYRSIITEDLGA